jgi:glycine dehydrogenase
MLPNTGAPGSPTLRELLDRDGFIPRHIGPDEDQISRMLDAIGVESVDALIAETVPTSIRMNGGLDLEGAVPESEVLDRLRALADRNTVVTSCIGTGWYDTHLPAVIGRNVLENPAWYTAYTPYQPEISQGRLEVLLGFQTMVSDLTGMDIANASLLDEATAAAEAMALLHRASRGSGDTFLVDADCHPQVLEVVRTRARPLGLVVHVADPWSDDIVDGTFGALLQYPGSSGRIRDLGPAVTRLRAAGVGIAVATDLLACCLMTPPGDHDVDVVIGSAQRFGVPMGFGGPHAGFMAVADRHRRTLPGRLVGTSVDNAGAPAHRLALQTREQHIRREKATSNICTAQVLLAVISALYAAYHGPDGLRRIAERVQRLTSILAAGLRSGGHTVAHEAFFDTITVVVPGGADKALADALEQGCNIRRVDADTIGISLDETTTPEVVEALWRAFGVEGADAEMLDGVAPDGIPAELRSRSEFCTAEFFTTHHSETSMLRWLRRLADRDLAMDRTMIPLGSCTMKLNATTEMAAISWPEFARIHPLAPIDQVGGYHDLIADLERMLVEITGYDRVSFQPNAGSQGELAGLLAIRAWHDANGDGQRTACLIPASAHGTNAASAVMAGMDVVVIECDSDGNVDFDHLKQRVTDLQDTLAALMITYPSTHGVFEPQITEICNLVHQFGGQVYLDGANLNAMVGLARPGKFGADVSHLNLHKTFCIPHGGGGPGVGPVAVREHLAPYLPNHPMDPTAGPSTGVGTISAAPFGSAGILPISWAYITLMGAEGLQRATEAAIVSANYVATRLGRRFPVLYTGANGRVAHECILDTRVLKASYITAEDICKRLIDYGFHAPTVSFPVPGTIMVEPTESEDLAELDRFCEAMESIADEAALVADGHWPVDDNPLVNAPHTARAIADEWTHPYDRATAAFPMGATADKYWPPVGRIDGAHGDKNLVCSCPEIDNYR